MDKQGILREIRRTAAANGGSPVGWRRFTTETGIREADWLGKYWARWSDALIEAGFEPNSLSVAYEKADLLERYASLTRELGRLPTSADLRLKDRQDATFPGTTVFERIGTKAQLIQGLIEHSRTHDHADVVAIAETYVPPTNRPPQAGNSEDGEEGHVYLLKSGRYHKIGRSNSAGRREYELAIQLPDKAKTIHVLRTDDPVGIEAYWHKRFETRRKNGEWFDLDAADVAAFKRRKFR